MDPMTWIAAANAAANIAGASGGFFGGSGTEGLSRQDQRWLADFQWKQSLRNEEFITSQAERNSLSGRVAEAERLGISPLVAAGINPSSSGGFGSAFSGVGPASSDSSSKWRGLQDMGQNLQRAASAVSSPAERAQEALILRNQSLQNDLLETQVANARNELMRHSQPPAREPMTQTMWDSRGRPSIQPSEAWSSANAGSILGTAEWYLDNKLIPFVIGGGEHTPGYRNVPFVKGQVKDSDLRVIGNKLYDFSGRQEWNPK